jgi:putative transposase
VPAFHPDRCHQLATQAGGGYVGVDLGLVAFAVAATSGRTEVGRWHTNDPLRRRLRRVRRCSRAFRERSAAPATTPRPPDGFGTNASRSPMPAEPSSTRSRASWSRTHARLAIENLAVDNLVRNNRLARAVADAAWSEFARQLAYKAGCFGRSWWSVTLVASSRTCSRCGTLKELMGLAERVFRCDACELITDRDRNAAANLAAWGRPCSGSGPPSGRPGHQCLWRGRRWPLP